MQINLGERAVKNEILYFELNEIAFIYSIFEISDDKR
jgi:hypothetical protein